MVVGRGRRPGKSTLIRVLGRHLTPDRGTVSFDERRLEPGGARIWISDQAMLFFRFVGLGV
ncbi:MAG: hypothetical protein OES24_23540 [Acidimicrobiia bacterium]|nr:hypothetical protein [Acidimicrobiia bacterium]